MSDFPTPESSSEPIRLSKRLMELIHCSRREAELYIEGGWVTVNGVVVEHPQAKVGSELIELHPNADLTRAGPVSIIVHSAPLPVDVLEVNLESANRWAGDTYPIPMLSCHLRRLRFCLPLPQDTEGMQVLTQDPALANYLATAQTNLEQEFVVQVQGELTPAQLAQLNHGLIFQGKPLRPASVSWQTETRLRFALKNPAAGQIKWMCEQMGLQVQHIKRIRIGAIPLKKMPMNQWRYFPNTGRF